MPLCPACNQRRRGRGLYLCRPCWMRLPQDTRRALWLKDAPAPARYLMLLQELKRGLMPDVIHIA